MIKSNDVAQEATSSPYVGVAFTVFGISFIYVACDNNSSNNLLLGHSINDYRLYEEGHYY